MFKGLWCSRLDSQDLAERQFVSSLGGVAAEDDVNYISRVLKAPAVRLVIILVLLVLLLL